MPEEKEQTLYIAVLGQMQYGKNPVVLYSLISMPNEEPGQLASRMEQYQKQQGYIQKNGYDYTVYVGELTHQVAPPPPPKPVALEKITKMPVAVPRRTGLKTIQPK